MPTNIDLLICRVLFDSFLINILCWFPSDFRMLFNFLCAFRVCILLKKKKRKNTERKNFGFCLPLRCCGCVCCSACLCLFLIARKLSALVLSLSSSICVEMNIDRQAAVASPSNTKLSMVYGCTREKVLVLGFFFVFFSFLNLLSTLWSLMHIRNIEKENATANDFTFENTYFT